MNGSAVKITVLPEQKGFDEGVIVTPPGRLPVTNIVISLEVAGLPLTQFAFEVIRHLTTSPITGQ